MSLPSSNAARLWIGLVATASVMCALATPTAAQTANPPRHFAIRDARIVTVSGEIIERGTIVMKNGLITAVGVNVSIPADAWEIDGAGLTVYPGLVDGLSNLGVPTALRAPKNPRGRRAAGGGGPPGADTSNETHSWGPEDRPATFTWLNAADELDPEDDRISDWRNAGFTSVVTSPERGLFPGQAALINLAGDRATDMVVKTPVAMRVNFTKGSGFPGYPGNLLGVLAYVRQLYSDAAHYSSAWSIYDRSPTGQERPTYDRALEPIRDAVANQMPTLLPATFKREITRAIRMGREVGVNTVIYGAHEAYAVVDELAAANATVLVSLDWPRADADGDPDADVPLATLRLRDRAHTTPHLLHDAGVSFAFYSDGLDDPATTLRNAARAVRSGLPEDAAVRALTLDAARIFGVDDRLGSLEVGKIANVIVSRGSLFDADHRVTHVFVDGQKYDVPETETVANARGRPGNQNDDQTDVEVDDGPPIPMVNDRGPITNARVTLITNATILTVSNGTIENGSILVRDGKIAQIGQNISAPSGAHVIDATGKYVMPGIVDAHSHIAADGINEGSVAVSAMVGIQDVLNPEHVGIYRGLAGGVTSANVLHGSANPIGGQNAVIKLRWGADAQGLLLDGAPAGIKFALGENTKRTRTPARYPNSRMGVMDVIRQSLLEAQAYQEDWSNYERQGGEGNQNLIPPRRDYKLDALVEILEGTRLVHAHSYRADEILQLLRLAEEFGFRIATLQHVLEGYRVADEIAEHGAGASTFSDWWGYKVEAYEAIPHNAAIMTNRGVVVSINSDSGEEMRHLNQEAAKTMKWGGLSEEEALRLVTLNPAIQLGIDDRVGSLEVGKDADIAIFSDHPLSIYAIPEMTLIDGQVYFDRQVDIDRREALENEKEALLEKQQQGGRNRERVVTDIADTPGR